MAKAEATLELVSKIRPAELRLHSAWAKQAAKVAPGAGGAAGRRRGRPEQAAQAEETGASLPSRWGWGDQARTGIRSHQGLPPRGSPCGNGFRGDPST